MQCPIFRVDDYPFPEEQPEGSPQYFAVTMIPRFGSAASATPRNLSGEELLCLLRKQHVLIEAMSAEIRLNKAEILLRMTEDLYNPDIR